VWSVAVRLVNEIESLRTPADSNPTDLSTRFVRIDHELRTSYVRNYVRVTYRKLNGIPALEVREPCNAGEMVSSVNKHIDVVLPYHHTPASEGTRPGRQVDLPVVGPG
jgi:hypothetical protein